MKLVKVPLLIEQRDNDGKEHALEVKPQTVATASDAGVPARRRTAASMTDSIAFSRQFHECRDASARRAAARDEPSVSAARAAAINEFASRAIRTSFG